MLLPYYSIVNFGRCFANWQWDININIWIDLMADVNAIIVLADVNAIDGWKNAIQIYVDDVISTWFLADVIANSVMWLMLLLLWQMS